MSDQPQVHEDYSREEEVVRSSERAFGLVFAAVFSVVAGWPLLRGGDPRVWALGIAAVFLLFAWLLPGLLAPLNRAWFRLGLVMHRVVSPVVLGGLFFLTVTPVAFLMRLFGKRPLSLRFDSRAESYWIRRDVSGSPPDSMKRQF